MIGNVGFGAAFNQAFPSIERAVSGVLNDDATAHPGWLEALLKAVEARAGCRHVRIARLLAGDGRLDSAGMLLCRGRKQQAARSPGSA